MELPSYKELFRNPIVVTAVILGVASLAFAGVVMGRLYQLKSGPNTIAVTGSTRKIVVSDVVKWSASFSRNVGTEGMKEGTELIKKDTKVVNDFLTSNGVKPEEVIFNPLEINTEYSMSTDASGRSTQILSGYTLTQRFAVHSSNIDQVTKAATNSGSLIASGVFFQASSPEYYYSKLQELKVELLSVATQDARSRAEQIAKNSDSSLGGLRAASMGVTQITPENSSDISDSGYYDTSSIRKEVMIIVHATFFVK